MFFLYTALWHLIYIQSSPHVLIIEKLKCEPQKLLFTVWTRCNTVKDKSWIISPLPGVLQSQIVH